VSCVDQKPILVSCYCPFTAADDDDIDDNVVLVTTAVVPLTYSGRYFDGNSRL
jgi:hypothetical protein